MSTTANLQTLTARMEGMTDADNLAALIALTEENLAKATKLGMRDLVSMTRRELRTYRAALADLAK